MQCLRQRLIATPRTRRPPPIREASGAWLAGGALVLTFQVGVADQLPASPSSPVQKPDLCERIWQLPKLYQSEENALLQEFSLVGRYHGQFWAANAESGNADGWENRRFYLGAEAKLFRQVTLHTQIKISEDFVPFYDGLYQAYAKWSPSDSFSLRAGRLDFLFAGLERTVSSTKIVTFERGLLANQLLPREVVGALAEGGLGKWSCRAGILSGSIDDEFTEFAGGIGVMAGVGCRLPLCYESGSLHLDYLFNNGNPSNTALAPYGHVVSLWHQGHAGPFGLGLDLTWADGLDAHPAVFGVTALPTYVFAKSVIREGDAFQAVLRYQFAVSDADDGLGLPKRYEQEVLPGGSGDRYHAVYAGINYLFFGDRLKLMTGAEYSVMHNAAHDAGDFEGWTYLAGVRLYF